VSWNTTNDAVLAEERRLVIDRAGQFDRVAVIAVDEPVVRHEAPSPLVEVRALDRFDVPAPGRSW
jgi:hypothetical protein